MSDKQPKSLPINIGELNLFSKRIVSYVKKKPEKGKDDPSTPPNTPEKKPADEIQEKNRL